MDEVTVLVGVVLIVLSISLGYSWGQSSIKSDCRLAEKTVVQGDVMECKVIKK